MLYDITNDLFSAPVYPGDPVPGRAPFKSIGAGDACNLTVLTFGSHAGTHMDAPRHFVADGATIDEVPLARCIGPCRVVTVDRMADAPALAPYLLAVCRLLLRGCEAITPAAARLCVERGVWLLGLEGQSVGDHEVHRTLLGAGIPVLEGLCLAQVPDGAYHLMAQPLKLGGLDGAPVRAVLETAKN